MVAYKAKPGQRSTLPPIDESVQIPAAIRAAAARSDALHKQAYKTEDAPANPQDQPNGKETPKEPAATEPKTPETTTEPKTTEPNNPQDWEHRYNSMKGRNEANERALGEQGRELAELRAQIQRLSAAPAPEQKPTNENTFNFKKITDEDRTNFGEDFIDVAKRAAAEVFQPEIERLKEQVTQLGGTVENVARTTHDNQTLTMNEKLDRDLPTWRDINRDPKFLSWVGLRDPYSGAIRIEMMREAHAKGDAQRVLNFFKGFLSDEATTAPQPQNDLLKPKADKVDLKDLAAPGRAKASASDVPSDDPVDKEIITRAQVTEFYRLVNSGYYRGRDDEKNALEQRIFNANNTGRIR